MQPAAGAGAPETFRPDIEGLRGIAILLVLLFHSGLLLVPGGYIGVDVFFVISGFLITGLLIRERERSGAIRLRSFYARRVRRLLPAGMVALACTLVASFAMLAPLDRPSAALDGAAAALSVGNIRFALAAGDYFAAVESPSPFLHFWSLAVEEQFYLVWPALVLVATRCSRPRLGAGLVLALVFAASLAANVVVTEAAASWAFYSLPTRAWQLALGGLLALGTRPLRCIPASISAIVGWAGVGMLAWAAITLDSSLAYPGLWALVPTLATAAMLVAGMTPLGPALLLSTAPIRFLGRISYSLYLWHWPMLVLPAAAMEGALPAVASAGLVAMAIVVAWASWRFIEEPFRAGFPVLARYPGRTILAGGAAVALVVTTAGGLATASSTVDWVPVDSTAALVDPAGPDLPRNDPGSATPSEAGETIRPSPAVTPADPPGQSPTAPASTGPTVAPSPSVTPGSTPSPTPRTDIRLPKDVRPALANARADEERLRRDGCLAFEGVTVPPDCVYGNRRAPVTVALVGDSHAAQWFSALEQIAAARGWRVITFVKVSCPFIDMRVRNIALKREYRECATFNQATIERLRDARPTLTIVSISRFAIHPVLERDTTVEAQAAAVARMLDQIPGQVAVIVDTPDAGRDVPACLSRHTSDVRACAIAWTVASAGNLGDIERLATATTGDSLIDLTSRVCRGDPCPVVVDGMIVFRDARHLTATFARSLAPDLDRALVEIGLPTS